MEWRTMIIKTHYVSFRKWKIRSRLITSVPPFWMVSVRCSISLWVKEQGDFTCNRHYIRKSCEPTGTWWIILNLREQWRSYIDNSEIIKEKTQYKPVKYRWIELLVNSYAQTPFQRYVCILSSFPLSIL